MQSDMNTRSASTNSLIEVSGEGGVGEGAASRPARISAPGSGLFLSAAIMRLLLPCPYLQ